MSAYSAGSRHPHTVESRLLMGTTVSVTLVGKESEAARRAAVKRAFDAMNFVERMCSRFDETSALRELCRHPGQPVRVPVILFEALRVALELSELTDGAFDPTVGALMEKHGFDRHYLTGERTTALRDSLARATHTELRDSLAQATHRDILLDEQEGTVLLRKPLLLDLGAVAKGLAVDLAARELGVWQGFAIDAGGDLRLHGTDPAGDAWTVGIRHPLVKQEVICWLQTTDTAICTSGSYERRSPVAPMAHHLLDPRTGQSVTGLLSCTVATPLAILADAASTAAFLAGNPARAIAFLSGLELAGLCISDTLDITKTDAMEEYMQ